MKQTIFTHGLLAGVATIAYAFSIYTFQKAGFFSTWFYVSTLVIYGFSMYFASKKAISEDFKVVLRTAFAVFLIANALYYAFDFILFNYMDKSLAAFQADAAIAYLKPNTPLEELHDRQVSTSGSRGQTPLHRRSYGSYALTSSRCPRCGRAFAHQSCKPCASHGRSE